MAALCWCVSAQTPPAKDAGTTVEYPRLLPRGSAADYPVQAKTGKVTIGADFMRHAVPTPQSQFNSEDYVVVEVGFYGPAGEHATLSVDDFSLVINGKKPVQSVPYGKAFESLKDPEWEPPELPSAKKSGGLSTGEGGGQGDPPPLPPKMPLNLVRIMQQKVQKSAMPEGDRALPEAGLLFFPFRGKSQSIKSVELVYSGPAGKAKLALQP